AADTREADRSGDAVYRAVEAVLGDPKALAHPMPAPEALTDRARPDDPIGRATSIGRFVGEAGVGRLAVSVARVLSGVGAAIVGEEEGHAGAVARLASLAVTAEALEG